ncbi:MAG: hypothetical protein V1658_01380, partial [Candidatus Micrarchaeota archaeon]
IAKLKELGGFFAEKAYLRGEKRLVNLIIISYAVAKFMEKHYVRSSKEWVKFYAWFQKQLQAAIEEVRHDDISEFYSIADSIVEEITRLSDATGRFQSNVIQKARIKAGTQIYAHGASLLTAANFSGADQAELASYINVTKLPDKYGTLSVKQRMKMAEEIFGI